MARRKAEAVAVPASTAEALALIQAYVDDDHAGALEELRAAEAIQAVKAELARARAEREARQKPRFAGLKAWWEAAGAGQFAGRNRSAEVGGARLGTRLTPPALKLPRGRTSADVLRDLMDELGGEFIRTRHELDREAIIAALRAPPAEDTDWDTLHSREVLTDILGLAITQTDEFFIDTGSAEPEPRKEAAAG